MARLPVKFSTSSRHENNSKFNFSRNASRSSLFGSENSNAWKDFYEVPGGDQVAAVPPRGSQ
eukprot:1335593-Pyramimonas_sp.AAC.1